jgi:hypothetical protein
VRTVVERISGWIPRADRQTVSLSGFALLDDARMIDIAVTNLSRDGCEVRTDELLKIGGIVRLTVPPFSDIRATVRWSLFGRAGVRFLESGDT